MPIPPRLVRPRTPSPKSPRSLTKPQAGRPPLRPNLEPPSLDTALPHPPIRKKAKKGSDWMPYPPPSSPRTLT